MTVLMALAAPAAADVSPHGGMMRFPDVSATHIVFVYADDLYVVPRAGGQAMPLASPPGAETFPKFSPDGRTIAFVGNYDGNRDLYTISIDGGVPKRITHHPAAETLCDWTPDGKSLLYFSAGPSESTRFTKLLTVSAEGGMPELLPVPYGTMAAISPDGTWLAYTPITSDFRTWKRYRGGRATDIWLFNLKDKTSQKITDFEGTDTLPMWSGDGKTLYYLSDNGPEHRLNLWTYDVAGKKHEQLTRFKDWDIKWPSIYAPRDGSAAIVFQNGSELYVYDARTNASTVVKVTIPGDRPTLRERLVDVRQWTYGAAISPTGKRVAVEARGDIWTAPAEKGSPRNLTRSSASAERYPSWSPDGRWIAYFSDVSGEYELYIRQSDGKSEPRQLTPTTPMEGGDGEKDVPATGWRMRTIWSPDSKHLVMIDKTATLWLLTIGEEGAATSRFIDKDPWGGGQPTLSWSQDSRWIAYDKSQEAKAVSAIWIFDTTSGERHQVTSGQFDDQDPVFDRKGNYLFFKSTRSFSPQYSELDTTFIYNNSQNLLAVPLRADMDSPYAPKSDEETWKDEKKKDDAKNGEKKDGEKEDDDKNGDDEKKDENGKKDEKVADDGVSGEWSCMLTGMEGLPQGGVPFTMNLTMAADGSVTGSMSSAMGSGSVDSGRYDKATGKLTLSLTTPGGPANLEGTIKGNEISGSASMGGSNAQFTGTRAGGGSDDEEKKANGEDKAKPGEKGKVKEVKIDFDGFERRAIMLPVPNGRFGILASADNGSLVYARLGAGGGRGGGGGAGGGIKMFDINDEKKQEKEITGGGGNFQMSADGKQILVTRGGGSATIYPVSAGATGKEVVTSGMLASIDPRAEWKQIFTDAWRIQRDFFYDPTMHGMDWDAVRVQYEKMIDDCATRGDVSYVIAEMISELNVGHAYYSGGDVGGEPSMSVGMLGCDFELHENAYRIGRIYEGGVWDADARGPLSQPGVKVKSGDYLLAVNGVPVDTTRDPWAAFIGMAGRTVTLTVSENPTMDDKARDVVIDLLGSESNLRYRWWIERNRKYVEEKTGGRVGYIYVPDTGVNGQNDLVRQFLSQSMKEAIIIDERWNGGGQIPTRFIEMLNRPVVNYWARRDGKDWVWPPDSHQGPKCMLINGSAGSGGDAFPHYFRQAGLGKLIGTRTWGGLIGITGYPPLVDGGNTTAPSFAFYENDGTWGIEGHGVDPDIEVLDDPAKMQDGGDPQLDAAIELMLEELKTKAFTPPARPAYPDRRGFGLPDSDK